MKSLPLVIVSQVQRSGGSMMAQLFDHHPQLRAHPFEIQTGFPNKWNWIDFNFEESLEEWFEKVFEQKLAAYELKGAYTKAGANEFALKDNLPFSYSKSEHKLRFLNQINNAKQLTNRTVYDAYFNSFFNTWKNGLNSEHPRCITGFTPRLNMYEGEAEKYFRDYPDGLMISLVRNPLTWYASVKKHSFKIDDSFSEFETREDMWMTSLQRSLELKHKYPNKVLLLTYEQVVNHTEPVMRFIAQVLGIEFDPVLLRPTYAGYDTYPNSSFNVDEKGVKDRTQERMSTLTDEEIAQINAAMLPSYELFSKHTDFKESADAA